MKETVRSGERDEVGFEQMLSESDVHKRNEGNWKHIDLWKQFNQQSI